MNKKELRNAIERMCERLTTWNEDAIIYRHTDGRYECDPRSTYDAVAREHKTEIVFECHDLNDIFPGFGECIEDVDWLLDSLMENEKISSAASTLGRLGGSVKSDAKSAAARENGKLGGRPRKDKK